MADRAHTYSQDRNITLLIMMKEFGGLERQEKKALKYLFSEAVERIKGIKDYRLYFERLTENFSLVKKCYSDSISK